MYRQSTDSIRRTFVTQPNAVYLASGVRAHRTFASFLHAVFTFCWRSDVNADTTRESAELKLKEKFSDFIFCISKLFGNIDEIF